MTILNGTFDGRPSQMTSMYDADTQDQIAAINALIEETLHMILNNHQGALERAKGNDSEVAKIHLEMMRQATVLLAPHRKLLTDILSLANMTYFVAMKEHLDG